MNRRTSAAGFLLLAALWGASYPAIKAGLAGFPPLLFAAVRFDAVAVLVLGYAAVRRRTGGSVVRGDGGTAGAVDRTRVRPTRAELPGVALGGALLVGVHNGLLFVGQDYVSSAIGAIVLSTVPLLSAAFSLPLLPDERVSPGTVAGILLGLVGVGIVADPDPGALLSPDLVGVGLLLCSAAAFALGAVLVRRTRTDLPVAAMQGWMMAVGAATLHVGSVVLGEPQAADLSLEVLIAYVYLVPVAGALGYLLYFALLDALGPVEINLVGYVAPVFAALVGWALLGEAISLTTWLGFGVICTGFVLAKRRALGLEFG